MGAGSGRDGVLWAAWAGGSLAVFGAIEGWALATGRPTLSRQVYDASKRWLIVPFLSGCAVGALANHFWGMAEPSSAGAAIKRKGAG